ncbi:MAG: GNAT family N-acetyltransferase [Chloroflexi bacterium]|nr:GNAT family N-acetyltransferase [Chloroflexota bacterium]
MDDNLLYHIPREHETERLILRARQPGDGRMVYEAVVESFAMLSIWMDWAKSMPTLAESENFGRESAQRFLYREELNYILLRKPDLLVVGALGVHHIRWNVPAFELGYWGRTRTSGNGYITEAVRVMTRYLFDTLGAERVEIRCDSRNERSAAVARRSGYPQEAVLRREARANDGQLRDTLVFAMLREDYAALTRDGL